MSQLNINKEELLKSFAEIKNRINTKIMKCIKTIFSKEGLIKI